MKLLYRLFPALLLVACHGPADTGVPQDYPLKQCPISGEKYGSGGMKAVKVTQGGVDVWLCCKSCKGDFEKDPAKYVKLVKDAAGKP
jgi:YHS domain-containing protein